MYKLLLLFTMITVYLHVFECDEKKNLKKYGGYKYEKDVNGWVKFHRIHKTWLDAWYTCYLEGSFIASPISEAMNNIMQILMKRDNMTRKAIVFTGISELLSEGVFLSTEGISEWNLTMQWTSRKYKHITPPRCVMMHKNGFVDMASCSERYPFVCFKPFAELEYTGCSTTDKDYKLNAAFTRCFKIYTVPMNFSLALRRCEADGGVLAQPQTMTEVDWIKGLYATSYAEIKGDGYKDAMFLGIHNQYDHSGWRTLNGLRMYRTAYADVWGRGEPNNKNGNEYCGTMFKTNGELNDSPCDVELPFACEIPK